MGHFPSNGFICFVLWLFSSSCDMWNYSGAALSISEACLTLPKVMLLTFSHPCNKNRYVNIIYKINIYKIDLCLHLRSHLVGMTLVLWYLFLSEIMVLFGFRISYDLDCFLEGAARHHILHVPEYHYCTFFKLGHSLFSELMHAVMCSFELQRGFISSHELA